MRADGWAIAQVSVAHVCLSPCLLGLICDGHLQIPGIWQWFCIMNVDKYLHLQGCLDEAASYAES